MKKISGFTLIELLVAISILAILSTVGLVSFQSVRNRANDAKIRADLDAIKKAYEQNFDPSANGGQGGYKELTDSMFAGGKIPKKADGSDYVLIGPEITGPNNNSGAFLACSVINGGTGTCSAPSSTCACVSSSGGSGAPQSYVGPCTNNCAKASDGVADCTIIWTPTTDYACSLVQTTSSECYFNQTADGGTSCSPAACTPASRTTNTCTTHTGYTCVSDQCIPPAISLATSAVATAHIGTTSPFRSSSGFTINAVDNRLLLVTVGMAGGSQSVSSITWTVGSTQQSLSYVNNSRVYASNNRSAEIWYLVAPTAGTGNIAATVTVSNTNIIIGAASFKNVNQTTPLDTVRNDTGYSTSASVSSISTGPGQITFDSATAVPTVSAAGSGQTLLWNSVSGSATGVSSYKNNSDSSTYTLGSSGAWGISAVSIKPLTIPAP